MPHSGLIGDCDPAVVADDVKRAVAARDAAARRVRRVTAAVAVAGLGATVAFTSLAAGSTKFRKVEPRTRASVRGQSLPRVTAPAPPLVGVGGTAPAPRAPTQAPSAVPQAPVVVSGGS
jgi:hypothetical protein